MVIFKWTLSANAKQTLQMPAGAKLLTVQVQNNIPRLWALCDETAQKMPRIIEIHGTGNRMPDDWHGEYVATFQVDNGSFVFHVFDATEPHEPHK